MTEQKLVPYSDLSADPRWLIPPGSVAVEWRVFDRDSFRRQVRDAGDGYVVIDTSLVGWRGVANSLETAVEVAKARGDGEYLIGLFTFGPRPLWRSQVATIVAVRQGQLRTAGMLLP